MRSRDVITGIISRDEKHIQDEFLAWLCKNMRIKEILVNSEPSSEPVGC
jgi:hypothetical protein